MDDLVKPERMLVDDHLEERALEAASTDRADLLDAKESAHLAQCERCKAEVRSARSTHAMIGDALALELDDAALRAMVATAIEAAVPTPEVRAPSRRSLGSAAVLGAAIAITLGLASLGRVPSLSHLIDGLTDGISDAWALSTAGHRLVRGLLPGGWSTVAVALSILAALSLAPLRFVLRLPAVRASALVLLGAFAFVPRAHALDFEGEWPAEEHLTVSVDGLPTSAALEQAAQAAGLGFVGALSVDPPTHLRVRDASLRDVVIAILGPDAPIVVTRTPTLLMVRPRPAPIAPPVEPVVVAPAVPSTAAPVATPSGPVDDRVAFGGDVTVHPGEVVASAVAFGGDAIIEGEVMEDVVAFGGDVHVQPSAEVHGEIVAFGGEVQIEEGARASAPVEFGVGNLPHSEEAEPSALERWVQDTLSSGASHALLFLFGLLLLGLAPARIDEVTRALTTAPGRSATAGLFSFFAAILLGLVLAITIVGIPAALVLGLATAIAVYVGFVAVALVIGRALPLAFLKDSPVRQLGAGVVALFIVSGVPVIDALAAIAGIFVGLGAVVLTRGGGQPAAGRDG